MSKRRIIQLFNWNLLDIKRCLWHIRKQGFTDIQISPLQGTKQPAGRDWWVLYQPINYKIGNELGSINDLRSLCNNAKSYNLNIIADVVLHHVANCKGNDVSRCTDFEILNTGFSDRLFYDTSFDYIEDYNNMWECTHKSLGGLPPLNLSNIQLRCKQFNFLKELIDCGVHSFRFDALKHLSSDNEYFEDMAKVMGPEILARSYGECIENTPIDIVRHYQKYMKVGVGLPGDQSFESAYKNDPNIVFWSYSHDDEFTFGKPKKNLEGQLRDYEHILRDYEGDTIFYASPYDDTWCMPSIKFLHELYQ